MPKRKKKKRENKHEYTYHYEPICECMECGNEHLRRNRIKFAPKDGSRFLIIRLCPKCEAEGYTLVGDKEVRRIKKDNVEPEIVIEEVVVIENDLNEVFDVSTFSRYVIPENNLGQFKEKQMPSFDTLVTKLKMSLQDLLANATKEFKRESYWKQLGLAIGLPGNVRAGRITKVKNNKGDYVTIPVSSISLVKKIKRVKNEH